MPPRNGPLRSRLALATATVLSVVLAGTAAAAGTPASASADGAPGHGPHAVVGPDHSGGVAVNAGYLSVDLDRTGRVTALTDTRTGRNYVATGHGTAPLVSLMVSGKQVQPTKLTLRGNDTLVFTGPAGFEVDVLVGGESTYDTFTVTKAVPPRGGDLQTLLWGPLATTIAQTLGEAVGIARDNNFAIGMKPLTDRTEGGWPREEVNTSVGWQNEVDPNPSALQVALPLGLEEWSVGGRTPWGSLLRAFTFDYTRQRGRMTDATPGYPIPVGPLPGSQGAVVGSKIALYGTSPDMAPTVLSKIATDQDLPYPTINGQWQKTAQATTQPFLVLSDLNTADVDKAAAYAKAAGIKVVYSLPNAEGPWKSAGHYEFDNSFGGSDSSAAALVSRAKADGIEVGTHTLSNFVDTGDPYVSPTPSPALALGQGAALTQDLAAGDTTAHLASCAPLADGVAGTRLLVGDEFLTYRSADTVDGQCVVTGLGRGQWGTAAAGHEAGDSARRVPENEYGGALGGIDLVKATAERFAGIWNTTGVRAMSFDGLESASQSGWGAYGMATMVDDAYHGAKAHDGFIAETSRMGSNIWDGLSRASWGEVGSTSMHQVFVNNAYYEANYLPGMLGWISLNTSPRTLEDALARGAGLNAGAGLQTSVSALDSGADTATLLDDIKQWNAARDLGAFTAAQRARFQDQSTHWHLSVVTPGHAWSLQQLDAAGNPVGDPQPVAAPVPAFTTAGLPALRAGSLYEARLVTNSPGTIRYTVTSGTLPAGLTLNPDTGGITGVPTSSANTTFTVTAKGGPGLADAVGTFTTGTLATSPQVTLTPASGFVTRGGTATLTVSVANPGTSTMTGATARIALPDGWTTSTPTARLGSLAPKATATASWTVNVPADTAYRPQTSTVSVAYDGGPGDSTASLSVPVAYANLSETADNVGVTDGSDPGPGNFDGYGDSYSAQALADAGVVPDAKLTYHDVAFSWPSAAPGTSDNTTASGQIVQVSGSGTRLAFLGAGIGAPSGTVTVHYTDGSTSTGTLGFPNWLSDTPTQFGAEPVITATYRNTQSGPANHGSEYNIYYNDVPLTAGKTVAAVQLPAAPSLHVFALGIG